MIIIREGLSNILDPVRKIRYRAEVNRNLHRFAAEYRNYSAIILKDRPAGFFSIFFQVLAAYKIAQINGQELFLDFNAAPYFDSCRDEATWWDYYFASTGQLTTVSNSSYRVEADIRVVQTIFEQHQLSALGASLDRTMAHQLIQQIPIKEEANREVESASQSFSQSEFVVGLHYRGTDKVSGLSKETQRVDYQFVSRILQDLQLLPFSFSLFVATDEVAFISHLQRIYPGKLIFTDAERSEGETPIHFASNRASPYNLGMEALVDSILLSKCDFLFRCDSNLSHASLFFNPSIDYLNLSPLMQTGRNEKSKFDRALVLGRIEKAFKRKKCGLT